MKQPMPVSPGDEIERTVPVEHVGQDQGEYTVTLALIGSEDPEVGVERTAVREITLKPDEQRDVKFSLPITIEITEATYDLRARVYLRTESDQQATVIAEQTEPKAVVVEKPTAELRVTTNPSGALVIVDNRAVGESPVTTTVPVGPKTVGAIGDSGTGETMVTVTDDGAEVTVVIGEDHDKDKPTESDFPITQAAGAIAVAAGIAYGLKRLLSESDPGNPD